MNALPIVAKDTIQTFWRDLQNDTLRHKMRLEAELSLMEHNPHLNKLLEEMASGVSNGAKDAPFLSLLTCCMIINRQLEIDNLNRSLQQQ